MAGAAVTLFLVVAIVTYYFNRPPDFCSRPTKLIQIREIPERTATGLAFGLLLAWCVFTILWTLGMVQEFLTQSYRNPAFVAAFGAGTIAVWTLARQFGANKLRSGEKLVFVLIFGVGMIFLASIVMLVQPMTFCVVGIIAFMMGRGKIPWLMLATVLVVAAFLNLGKGPARDKIWVGGSAPYMTPEMVIQSYETWIAESFNVIVTGRAQEREERSIFSRANLITLLSRVMNVVPGRKPYMYGETYGYIPEMLVPRVFWKNKPQVHAANNLISLNCGLSSRANLRSTTVGVGLLAEAWVNFGWAGIIGLAVIIGGAMRFMARALAAAAPTMMHGLISVVWVAYSFQVEQVTSAWFSSFSQAVLVMIIMLYPFSRPVRDTPPATSPRGAPVAPGAARG
ncbi:MAG: hypothetical protein JSS27_09645 [Planctomycetes bacterium]|nr:hypothetical protein [Planctomycetota bacterium]